MDILVTINSLKLLSPQTFQPIPQTHPLSLGRLFKLSLQLRRNANLKSRCFSGF